MTAFLSIWLEMTSFSTWLRESPLLLAFPAVLILHTRWALAFLAGGISAAIEVCRISVRTRHSLSRRSRLFSAHLVGLLAECRFRRRASDGISGKVADQSGLLPRSCRSSPPRWWLLRQIRIVFIFSDPNLSIARPSPEGAGSSGLVAVSVDCPITAGRTARLHSYTHLLFYADM